MLREQIEKMVVDAVKTGDRVSVHILQAEFGLRGDESYVLRVTIAPEKIDYPTIFAAKAGEELKAGQAVVVKQPAKMIEAPKGAAGKKSVKKNKPAAVKKEQPSKPASDQPLTKYDRFDIKRPYSTSDEDIRLMKIHLSSWKSAKKLSEDQKKDLDIVCGAWASKLSPELREKCLKLFNDVRKKIGLI